MTDLDYVASVARQNPRRKHEHPLVYCQRLCVLSGLLKPEETSGEPPDGWHDAGAVLEAAPAREDWWNR